MSKVKVAIVDDSPLMRQLIRSALAGDPDMEVVGEAGDPLEARQMIKTVNPDVLTLDVEMPNMNGLEFLDKIMRLRPMPVVMVSTLSTRGAQVSLKALEIGAFDCVAKPVNGDQSAFKVLPELLKAAAKSPIGKAPVMRSNGVQAPVRPEPQTSTCKDKLIAIGASTGGVEALIAVLQEFPANCPATIVTQHMPPMFTERFAQRLDRLCAPKVQEAKDLAPIEEGNIFIAPGGDSHLTISSDTTLRCKVRTGPPVNGHCPSVDVMFDSVVQKLGGDAVGVILTGMGRDGADGLLRLRQAGARTIGQSEQSCVVYGMPKAAMECGAVERQVPLDKIANEILCAG